MKVTPVLIAEAIRQAVTSGRDSVTQFDFPKVMGMFADLLLKWIDICPSAGVPIHIGYLASYRLRVKLALKVCTIGLSRYTPSDIERCADD